MLELKITGTTPAELYEQICQLAQAIHGHSPVLDLAALEPARTAEARKGSNEEQAPESAGPEEKPVKMRAAAKTEEAQAKTEIDEKTLRVFCAKAMKKGVDSASIIKKVSNGIGKISDIDPRLYPQIYAEIKKAQEQLNG